MSYTDFSRPHSEGPPNRNGWDIFSQYAREFTVLTNEQDFGPCEWVVWYSTKEFSWRDATLNQVTKLYTLEEAIKHLTNTTESALKIWHALIVNVNTKEFIPSETFGL